MATNYSAFLVRCWWRGEGAQRYEIQQVQSGERILVTSIAAVADYIRARSGPPDPATLQPPEPPGEGQPGETHQP